MAVIDVGCYSWDIHYIGANLCQITIPTEVSSHCEQYKYRHECFHSKSLTLKSNRNNSNGTHNKSKCNRKNPFGWCVYLVPQVK